MGSKSSTSNPTTTTSQADNRVAVGNDGANIGSFGTYKRNSDNSSAWNSGNTSNSNNTNQTSFDVYDSSSRDYSDHSVKSWSDARDFSNRSTNSTSFQVNDSSSRDNSDRRTFTDSRDLSNRSTTSNSFQVNDSSSRDSSDRRTFTDSRDLSSWTDSRDMSSYSYTGTDGGSVQIAQFNAGLLQAVSENQGDTVRALAQMGARGITDQAAAATNLFATGSAEATKAWGHTVDKSSELIDRLLTTAQGTITGAQTVARDAISSYQPTENKTAGTMQYALIAAAGIAAIFILKKA